MIKTEFGTQEYCFRLPRVSAIIWGRGFKVVRAWWLWYNFTVTCYELP